MIPEGMEYHRFAKPPVVFKINFYFGSNDYQADFRISDSFILELNKEQQEKMANLIVFIISKADQKALNLLSVVSNDHLVASSIHTVFSDPYRNGFEK